MAQSSDSSPRGRPSRVATPPARGVDLDAGRLVALKERVVSIRNLKTGKTILSRPIRRARKEVELLDSRAGLIAYRSGKQLRLLRLSDGRDARIPAPGADRDSLHARFGTPGLVVAFPGIVKVITWSQLKELLAAAR